jgi:hypothetical protein
VTPMREFEEQKALQNYVKLHDLVYLWEGARPFGHLHSPYLKAQNGRGSCLTESYPRTEGRPWGGLNRGMPTTGADRPLHEAMYEERGKFVFSNGGP